MKKTTLFLILFFFTAVIQAQRISSLTVEGKSNCVPFAAFNPTNGSETVLGDGQMVFPAGTDLSNVNVTISAGADASVVEPDPLPTNWTSTISGIKVQNSASAASKPNEWAKYTVTLKVIKPATLPLEIKTGTGNFNSDSWTTETVGWAGAAIDKGQTLIRLGSAKRSFMVAFTDAPDSLYYTIKALGTWAGSNNVFDIDGSADGVNWTSIKQYNSDVIMPPSSPAVKAELKLNNPGCRYIRWIYTTRNAAPGNFNVSLENVLVTKSSASGTATHYASNVKLYPAGSQNLCLESSEDVKSLRVYNISGTLVLEVMSPSSDISVNELVPGVYIGEMRLKSGNVVTAKFFK